MWISRCLHRRGERVGVVAGARCRRGTRRCRCRRCRPAPGRRPRRSRRAPRAPGPSTGPRRSASTARAASAATARAARRASSSRRGAAHRDPGELRRALGVARHLLGERAAHLGERVGERGELGRARRSPTPDAPLASTSTVSFVLVHPSTHELVERVVDRARAARPAARRGSIAASVVTTASIVAIAGREHRRALGHPADDRRACRRPPRPPPCGRCRW